MENVENPINSEGTPMTNVGDPKNNVGNLMKNVGNPLQNQNQKQKQNQNESHSKNQNAKPESRPEFSRICIQGVSFNRAFYFIFVIVFRHGQGLFPESDQRRVLVVYVSRRGRIARSAICQGVAGD